MADIVNKILYVINNLDIGGTEKHIVTLLPELTKKGIVPILFCIEGKGKLAEKLQASNIDILWAPVSSFFLKIPLIGAYISAFTSAAYLIFTIVRLRPQVIHFFMPKSYIIGGTCSLIDRNLIKIMSRRCLNNYQLKHPILRRCEKLLHKRMDLILGNSQSVCDQIMLEGVEKDKIKLIYNGINYKDYMPGPANDNIRKKLNTNGHIVILMISNLKHYKGHEDLFHALAKIKSKMPAAWKLLLAGRDDGCKDYLKKLGDKLAINENIEFLGERTDIPEIIRLSDIGVQPTYEEGFSNSILEMMAGGLAVIATDVGGNGEAIVDNDCGFLVPVKTPEILAGKLFELINNADLRQRLGDNARNRVISDFSMEKCVEQYLAIYQSCRMANVN